MNIYQTVECVMRTMLPSKRPSVIPSAKPSYDPSASPSSVPSSVPSRRPSLEPTSPPTNIDVRFIYVGHSILFFNMHELTLYFCIFTFNLSNSGIC